MGIDSETNAKVDELCSKISGMVTGYEISKVSIDKKNTATAIVKVDTSFPVNIAGDDETTKKIEAAAESYHTEHEDEIKQMYKDMGEEAATEQLYSKRIAVAVDTYSQIISDAQWARGSGVILLPFVQSMKKFYEGDYKTAFYAMYASNKEANAFRESALGGFYTECSETQNYYYIYK